MGMPITVEIVDFVSGDIFDKVFSFFKYIDQKFSTYKKNSEITKINDLRFTINESSEEMKTIFRLAEQTRKETNGYFDIFHNGKYDPSGIVKGWAIFNAAKLLNEMGVKNFYIDCGGDVQVQSSKFKVKSWKIGIKNPFKQDEIIKIIYLKNGGVATSGTYIRGSHIYNPKGQMSDEIVSLTVIGPNVYEADRFATAGFAMGKKGIEFIEKLKGFEGYQINKDGIATMTSGFEKYTIN